MENDSRKNVPKVRSEESESADTPYQNNELDWFRFENRYFSFSLIFRVRKMIGETINPIFKIIQRNGKSIGENRYEIDMIKPQLEDSVQALKKNSIKVIMVEDSLRKISDFEGDLRILDANLRKEIAMTENRTDKISELLKSYRDESNILDNMVDTLRTSIMDFEQTMYSQKEFMNSKFQNISKTNLEVKDSIEARVLKSERAIHLHSSRLTKNREVIEDMHANIEVLLAKQKNTSASLYELHKQKLDLHEFKIFKEYVAKDFYYAKTNIDKLTKMMLNYEM